MGLGDRADAAAVRRDVVAGLRQGALIAALTLAGLFPFLGGALWRQPAPSTSRPAAIGPAPGPAQPIRRQLDFGTVRAPRDVTQAATWAVHMADNGMLPFAIIDKRRAQVYVFAPGGRLLGSSPVLLGFAAGDLSATGIGHKSIDQILPQERTTPAGRFVSTPGRNALGDDVVWVDYAAAVSMHRVRESEPRERRLERLATPTPADNRISWGCINVPVAFFEQTVWPQLGHNGAIVYVLPEHRPLTAFFPAAAAQFVARSAKGRGNSAKP